MVLEGCQLRVRIELTMGLHVHLLDSPLVLLVLLGRGTTRCTNTLSSWKSPRRATSTFENSRGP